MKIKGEVVCRIRTNNHNYGRIRINGPHKTGMMKFFDIEDQGELCIGDKLTITIERVVPETEQAPDFAEAREALAILDEVNHLKALREVYGAACE